MQCLIILSYVFIEPHKTPGFLPGEGHSLECPTENGSYIFEFSTPYFNVKRTGPIKAYFPVNVIFPQNDTSCNNVKDM
jgi:hypothetical protein